MTTLYKIHPAIGIARVGDSTEFCLAPEDAGAVPIECDQEGNAVLKDGIEQPISKFKDAQARVKRQAARFRVYAYDDVHPEGREVQVGDKMQFVDQRRGQLIEGEIDDILWTVYLANKKASWYEFRELEGEHGYASSHPLRNAGITDTDTRQRLIIDPGPQTVIYTDEKSRSAEFSKGKNPRFAQSFPPPLEPYSIDTLGGIKATRQDNYNRLIVLGGFGRSGCYQTEFGEPMIRHFANNDGWFDDLADGPVTAQIKYKVLSVDGRPPDPGTASSGQTAVQVPAWVIVGYPRYAPQIVDIVTMDDVVYDVAIRYFAYNSYLYGVPPFNGHQSVPNSPDDLARWRAAATWNPEYHPHFWRDIWPILTRPDQYSLVMDFDPFTGGDPHNATRGAGGNFDPDQIAIPPYSGEDPVQREQRHARRMFVYNVLRKPGRENSLTIPPDPSRPDYQPFAMPFLCGDNPLSNTATSKFLRLTDTQLFLLKQWAEGKFIDERKEAFKESPGASSTRAGAELDRGVLSNLLGGSFCPGGEAAWIMRNPAIYAGPYRINQSKGYTPGSLSLTENLSPAPDAVADLSAGLEPGDITKYDAVPWQADFNECSTQSIDITYEKWNTIEPKSTGDPVKRVAQLTYWWPAHRPMKVQTQNSGQVDWSRGIPQSNAGDLKMVTAWKDLGFIKDSVEVERNDQNL
jgi:L-Lysine epsilon oxidase N-terminal/L-lysine epsilon oxidase C-terminal domain